MTSEKKYHIFVLLSTLSRGMIEIFIPIYLYKMGFSLPEIFQYFLFILIISFIVCYPLVWLGNKYKYKYLIFFSSIFLMLTYFILLFTINSIFYLFILALMYSLYRRCYWIGKRYYALKIIPKENMGSGVSKIVIITQVSVMLAAYIGALILNYTNSITLFIISISLFITSITSLIGIPEKTNDEKIILLPKTIIKQIPIKNIMFMMLSEAIYISSFIFPIYLYLFVSSSFQYIGIFNIFVGISSIIFIYFFSKKMDRDKLDYKYIAAIGLAIIFILKLNYQSTIIILIIALFEGVFSKMQNVSFTRNVYFLGSHYNKSSYNLVCELVQNFSRLFLFAIIFICTKDLKIILYICAFIIFTTAFIKFDDGEGGYL